MTSIRILTPETRQIIENKLSGPVDVITMHNLQGICLNLLHDLEVADDKIASLTQLAAINTTLRADLAAAQATIAQRVEYLIVLQQIIKAHGRGEFIPPELAEKSLHLAEQLAKTYTAMSKAVHTLAVPGYGVVGGIDVQVVDMANRTQAAIKELHTELKQSQADLSNVRGVILRQDAQIAQQGATIAAMREALEFIAEKATCFRFKVQPATDGTNALWPVLDGQRHQIWVGCDAHRSKDEEEYCFCCLAHKAIADTAKLAANHDAAVRAPLEAQIATLVGEITNKGVVERESRTHLWMECVFCYETIDYKDRGKLTHKPGCIVVNSETAQLAADYAARIQAEARADERWQVLEEVRSKWLTLSPDEWARWIEEQHTLHQGAHP